MSPALEWEWRKHRSLYAARWLAAMRSRRRVLSVAPDEEAHRALLAAVEVVGTFTPRQTAAVGKDTHLVAAAWVADRTVASCDDKMRALLCVLSAVERRLCAVVWVNPDTPDGTATRWLEAGARSEPFRRLAPPA